MKARLADLGGAVLAGFPTDFGKLIAEETVGQSGQVRGYQGGLIQLIPTGYSIFPIARAHANTDSANDPTNHSSSTSSRFGILELREPYRQNLLRRHSAVAVFFEEDEPLRVRQAGRNDHFPTHFQLMDQRRRYEVRSCCHDYLIERGVLGPTM